MATNLDIDDKLIDEARRIGNYRTKKEAVTAALDEFVRRRRQLEILDHFGTIDFDPEYDYRKMRQLDRIEIDER
jgi:Arc/MetJ family transcription regulator